MANALNELIKNLRKTFDTDEMWKEGDNLWEDEVNYPISDLLVTDAGRCNWDAIDYIEKNGNFFIHRGDGDSCGWLTGVILDRKTGREIVYG